MMRLNDLVEKFIEILAEDLIKHEEKFYKKYNIKTEYPCLKGSKESYIEMFSKTDKEKLAKFGEMVVLDIMQSINEKCGITKVKDAIDLRIEYLGK